MSTLLDAEVFGTELANLIRDHVSVAVKPLLDQIKSLKDELAAVPKPRDGKDADPEVIRAEVAKAIAEIPKPQDGKSIDPSLVFAEIGEAVKRAVDVLPKAKDGVDGKDGKDGVDGKNGADGKDGTNGLNGKDGANGLDGKEGPAGKDGINGKDGADGIQGKDGRDGVDGQEGAAGLNGKDGKDGLNGKDGVDGINGKDADQEVIIARVLDAIPKPRDGKDADVDEIVSKVVPLIPVPKDGKNVDPKAVAAMITAEAERIIAEMPPPKDGEDGINGKDGKNGLDGKDGLGLEDIDLEMKDERTIVFRLKNGSREVVKELKLGIPVYKGVYRSGGKYEKGDTATFSGSLWIALRDTSGAPGGESRGGSPDWALCVKKGADGKDAA